MKLQRHTGGIKSDPDNLLTGGHVHRAVGDHRVEQVDRRRFVSQTWSLPDPHQRLSVRAPETASQLPKRPRGTGMPSEAENSEDIPHPFWTYPTGWKKLNPSS